MTQLSTSVFMCRVLPGTSGRAGRPTVGAGPGGGVGTQLRGCACWSLLALSALLQVRKAGRLCGQDRGIVTEAGDQVLLCPSLDAGPGSHWPRTCTGRESEPLCEQTHRRRSCCPALLSPPGRGRGCLWGLGSGPLWREEAPAVKPGQARLGRVWGPREGASLSQRVAGSG